VHSACSLQPEEAAARQQRAFGGNPKPTQNKVTYSPNVISSAPFFQSVIILLFPSSAPSLSVYPPNTPPRDINLHEYCRTFYRKRIIKAYNLLNFLLIVAFIGYSINCSTDG
jgi:hypothetical protein